MTRFSWFGLPVSIFLVWGLLFVGSLVLPSVNTGIFASPDETAVAVSIQRISQTGSAAIPEPLARQAPWLHPRSYLAMADSLVPVGFLGWPWWLARLNWLIPVTGLAWFASLFAVSGSIPWYLLLRKRYGHPAAFWGTVLAWTFPPVLLYVNRSFFSHLPQYSLVLWSLWALVVSWGEEPTQWKRVSQQAVAGLCLGAALTFRPLEAIWMIPVFILLWSQFEKIQWRKQGVFIVGLLLGLVPLGVVQARTYGEWFQIGYWIQANTDPAAVVIPQLSTAVAKPWYLTFAPYGLHPRNVLWNVRSFFVSFLWPWTVALGIASVFVLSRLRVALRQYDRWQRVKKMAPVILVLGFTTCWLLLIYGSGLYADHVRAGAVTVANSFLRYTIPFGFCLAWGLAELRARLQVQSTSVLKVIFSVSALFLVVSGVYTAFIRDEEGILATRQELTRYTAVRAAAQAAFQSSDVVFSERSDKIFFPAVRAVSPLPTADQVSHLSFIASSTSLGLYRRPLSFGERDDWRKMGYDVHELQSFERERLYRLTPFLR